MVGTTITTDTHSLSPEAFPPVTRAASTVSNRDDLDSDCPASKNDKKGKPSQDHAARPKVVCRTLLRIPPDPIHRAIQLVEEHAGSSKAACPIPIDSRPDLFQRSRMDSQRTCVQRPSRARRLRRASFQGIRSTVPLSICCSLSSISRLHASEAPSSRTASISKSRLSMSESSSAERAAAGNARASRNSVPG